MWTDEEPLRAMAFDMDGLLVDTEPLWWRAEREVAEQLGGVWTDADSVSCVGGPMEKVADIIIKRTGRGDSAQIIADVISRVIALLGTEPVRWLPGAHQLIAECSSLGLPHALVSASPRAIVDGVLASLGASAASFTFSISADDVVATKPAPDPYLKAAQQFGCAPSAMMVFEDSMTGTSAAVASGAFVVAVPHAGGILPASRLQVISSLHGFSVSDAAELMRLDAARAEM
jgi:HAD superfamily hydrolase (TIGR01509 family)